MVHGSAGSSAIGSQNVMLSVLHAVGLDDLERFGDSDRAFNLSGMA
jgi:hypothetical protein